MATTSMTMSAGALPRHPTTQQAIDVSDLAATVDPVLITCCLISTGPESCSSALHLGPRPRWRRNCCQAPRCLYKWAAEHCTMIAQ